ncbi:hypothetical protein DF200_10250 [Bifidobacterium catulorum]|uniref:BIG2 domain-containing protein n=2 Tax=Bifidobacterium catulorum TaxID=1630173 RepID=A0A2U2MPZ8_9BIFI|nr:hypothetical protein DF200_10250 [Bifidobacterium catulorum]
MLATIPAAAIATTANADEQATPTTATVTTGDATGQNAASNKATAAAAEVPGTIEAWNERNATLDDWNTLSQKLQSTDGINWLFIGDSITHGVLYTMGYRNYAELFANQVESTPVNGVSRANDMVMNTAIASADARWPLKAGAFDKWVGEKHPNVVFITFGMNDGRVASPQKYPVETYKKTLETLITDVRAKGAIPILQTQNYTTMANENTSLDQYYNAERQLAVEQNVILLDFNKRWSQLNGGNNTSNTYMGFDVNNRRDSIHPGENGQIEWAKFILESLKMMQPGDALAKWSSSTTSLTGPSAGAADVAKGLTGKPADGVIAAKPTATQSVGKYLTGAQYVDLGTDVVDAAKGGDTKQSNVTIRFRANASDKPQTLLSFGDPANSGTRSLVRLSDKGLVQFVNSSAANDLYSVGSVNLADGAWHTLSVNFESNAFTIYADGNICLRRIQGTKQLNVPTAPNSTVTTVTVGAARDHANKGGIDQLNGVVDYVAVYDKTLSDADAKTLTAKPAAVQVNAVTGAADELKTIVSNVNSRANIVLAGGDTIEGGYTDHIIGKNVVQLLDENIRWEYANSFKATDYETQRAKFFVGAGAGGRTVEQMDTNYDTLIGQYKPNLLLLMPDLYDADGKQVETDAAAFGTHVKSIADKATQDGAKVVLVTPVTLQGKEGAFAEAMRTVAKDKNLPLIDSQDWITKVVAAEPEVKSAWYNANGQLNYAGHLGYAHFLMRSLGSYPTADRLRYSRTAALSYDKITTQLAGTDEDGGEVPVARSKDTADKAHIDGTQIDPSKSMVLVDHYEVHEVGEDGQSKLVDGLGKVTPETMLKNGVDVPVADRLAHTYKVVGVAAAPTGVDPIKVTYTAKLAAVPVPVKVNVTYALGNGGQGTVPTQDPVSEGTDITVKSGDDLTNTDQNLKFGGWKSSTDGKTYDAGDKITVGNQNVTLTAQWVAKTKVTLSYDANKGSGDVPASAGYNEGSVVKAAQAPATLKAPNENLKFGGWKKAADGQVADYQPGEDVQLGNQNVTLYAHWIDKTKVSVTYDANGGKGTVPTQEPVNEGSEFTVKAPDALQAPTDDQKFGGWLSSTDKQVHQAGDKITVGTENVTLTAQWVAKTKVTVTYDANGGSGDVPAAQNANEGATVKVEAAPAGMTAPKDQKFGGWKTTKDGKTAEYQAGDDLKVGTTDITLYAHWTAIDKVPVESLKVADENGKTSDIKVVAGKKLRLVVTFTPENATDKSLTWHSNDLSIATVNADGEVAGVSAGTATITATGSNGKSVSITVTVEPAGNNGNGGNTSGNNGDNTDNNGNNGNTGGNNGGNAGNNNSGSNTGSNANKPSNTNKPGLAHTGATVYVLSGFAALLIAAGAAIVVAARRNADR